MQQSKFHNIHYESLFIIDENQKSKGFNPIHTVEQNINIFIEKIVKNIELQQVPEIKQNGIDIQKIGECLKKNLKATEQKMLKLSEQKLTSLSLQDYYIDIVNMNKRFIQAVQEYKMTLSKLSQVTYENKNTQTQTFYHSDNRNDSISLELRQSKKRKTNHTETQPVNDNKLFQFSNNTLFASRNNLTQSLDLGTNEITLELPENIQNNNDPLKENNFFN